MKRVKTVLKQLLFLGVGVVLLWLFFRKFDINTIWNEIKNAQLVWIGLALTASVLSHIFRALRWNLLIENSGYKSSLSHSFWAVMFGYFANYSLPRAGEVGRCMVLSKREKIPFQQLFGTVISERLFDLVVLILMLVTTIVLQFDVVGTFMMSTIIQPLIDLYHSHTWLFIGFFVLLVVGAVAAILIYIQFTKRKQVNPILSKIQSFLEGLIEGVTTIFKLKKNGLFLLYTLGVWVNYLIMTWLPLYALSGTSHLGIMAGITILVIGSIGMVIPAPGGIGTYHFIVQAILIQIYGISELDATTFPTLVHGSQTIMIVILGIIGYAVLLFSNKTNRNESKSTSKA